MMHKTASIELQITLIEPPQNPAKPNVLHTAATTKLIRSFAWKISNKNKNKKEAMV